MDVNMRYDKNAYIRNKKQQLLNRVTSKYWQKPDLSKAEVALKQAVDKYNNLKAAIESPDALQMVVEEREKQYYQQQAADLKAPAANGTLIWNGRPLINKSCIRWLAAGPAGKSDNRSVDSSYIKTIEKK